MSSLSAAADPPPLPADQSQVFSPDQLIIIDSYPPFMESEIRERLANGEEVPFAGTNAAISTVTGEPLSSNFRKKSPVPAEVRALRGYVKGAPWGMTFTSRRTNYCLIKSPAAPCIRPVPPTPCFEFGINMLTSTNLLATNWVAEVVEVQTEASEPQKFFKLFPPPNPKAPE